MVAPKDQRTRPQALYIWRLKHSRLLAEIARVVRPGGTATVYDFITAGPESSPPHFVRRFGIVSEILRRATQLAQPFSLQDALDLGEGLRKPTIQVEVGTEQDMAVVK